MTYSVLYRYTTIGSSIPVLGIKNFEKEEPSEALDLFIDWFKDYILVNRIPYKDLEIDTIEPLEASFLLKREVVSPYS